jgi:hypothetical protein
MDSLKKLFHLTFSLFTILNMSTLEGCRKIIVLTEKTKKKIILAKAALH